MVTEKFYIGYSDTNKNYELSNVGLLNFFQNITTIHGKSANDSLKTSEFGWFLTNYYVKILKRPEYENWFNLSTWSKEIRGCLASREFEIKDENGNIQVLALSNWVRINKNTKKLERVSKEIIEGYGKEEHTNFDNSWIQKLQECENIDFEKEYTIDRDFIDLHNHMNNVCYLKLAYNVLPNEIYNQKEPCEFDIMYKKAIKYNSTVKCLYTETENYYNISIKSLDKQELYSIVRLYKNK